MNDEIMTVSTQNQDMSIAQTSAQAREQYELQAAFVMAKKFPRNEAESHTRIMKAFERPGLAQASEYRFRRGKGEVVGPSVDTARQLARCWGNLRTGFQVVDSTDEDIHIKGYCLDLESNTSVQLEDKFKKKVQRKNFEGETLWVTPDERDLRELINKRGAILVRNCILQVVPSDVVDDAIAQARRTLDKSARKELTTSKDDTIKAMCLMFDKIGVTVQILEQYLGHGVQAITPEQVISLRGIYKSITDGNSTRSEHFTVTTQQSEDVDTKTASIVSKIKGA